jgi:uncharacterized protein (DUF1501 family)
MNPYQNKRRTFLKQAGLVGAGLSTAGSSIFNLKNINAFAGQNIGGAPDYKALVCIYLGGGSDSFNMLIPRSNSEYNAYQQSRSNLAIPQDNLLPINPTNAGGIEYGLYPNMTNLQSLFEQGKMCFMANMGTLIDYTTKDQYYNGTGQFPLGLFSHSDQTNQWQSASPGERLNKGWAGRISDLLNDTNSNQKFSMNLSFSGTNIFQSSNEQIEFSVSSSGANTLSGYAKDYDWGHDKKRSFALDSLMSHEYNDPFKNTYRKLFRSSIDDSIFFNEIIDNIPDLLEEEVNNYLRDNLNMVAKIMAARDQLGFSRQIFFLDIGNWDTHDNLFVDLDQNFGTLDRALGKFQKAIEQLGLSDNVVTFTMSEFGRTLTSNGNGTDHAWGGNVLAIGGPVKGKKIYGEYPMLELDNNIDIGGGVLIPSTPNDLYFAELALWFGVPQSDLHDVLPNLGNFYAQGSSHAPLDFLNL